MVWLESKVERLDRWRTLSSGKQTCCQGENDLKHTSCVYIIDNVIKKWTEKSGQARSGESQVDFHLVWFISCCLPPTFSTRLFILNTHHTWLGTISFNIASNRRHWWSASSLTNKKPAAGSSVPFLILQLFSACSWSICHLYSAANKRITGHWKWIPAAPYSVLQTRGGESGDESTF